MDQARDIWTTMRTVAISSVFGGSATNTLWTPTAGRIFLVASIVLSSSNAVSLTFNSGSTALSGAIPFSEDTRVDWIFNGCPFFKGRAANDAFTLTSSGATTVTGFAVIVEPMF